MESRFLIPFCLRSLALKVCWGKRTAVWRWASSNSCVCMCVCVNGVHNPQRTTAFALLNFGSRITLAEQSECRAFGDTHGAQQTWSPPILPCPVCLKRSNGRCPGILWDSRCWEWRRSPSHPPQAVGVLGKDQTPAHFLSIGTYRQTHPITHGLTCHWDASKELRVHWL